MKLTNYILLVLLCTSSYSYSQNDDGKNVQFVINERASYFAVDSQYYLIKDTMYHSEDGFRVYSGYDILDARDGKKYVVLRYPQWDGKKQKKKKKQLSQIIEFVTDSIFISGLEDTISIDTLRQEIYTEILDSLKNLAEMERNKAPYHIEVEGKSGLKLAMLKSEFDRLNTENKLTKIYSLDWKHSTKFASGFMSVPFKLRPKEDTVNFNMTTDITLGAYLGIKKRISRKGNNHIIIPVTLGLSYINVADNKTSNVNTEDNTSVVPGWTWSSGVVFDFNGFNAGFVFGQDYASGIGSRWLYNGKMWYSFSIGYSFFSGKTK